MNIHRMFEERSMDHLVGGVPRPSSFHRRLGRMPCVVMLPCLQCCMRGRRARVLLVDPLQQCCFWGGGGRPLLFMVIVCCYRTYSLCLFLSMIALDVDVDDGDHAFMGHRHAMRSYISYLTTCHARRILCKGER